MKRFNATPALLPFFAGGAVAGVLLAFGSGNRGWALVGMTAVWFCVCFLGLLALYVLFLALSVSLVPAREGVPRPFFRAVISYTEGLIAALCRVRLRVSGLEKLPGGTWLLVCNHRSSFDPLITGWALRQTKLVFVTKPSLWRVPVLGGFLRGACFLSIDRENDRAALKTILEAARMIREGTTSVGIYPEGTRSTDGGLLPFRNGAFKIAQRAGAPIVIAVIAGAENIFRRFPWRRTEVSLEIRGVLDTASVKSMNTTQIGEIVRTCMNSTSC